MANAEWPKIQGKTEMLYVTEQEAAGNGSRHNCWRSFGRPGQLPAFLHVRRIEQCDSAEMERVEEVLLRRKRRWNLSGWMCWAVTQVEMLQASWDQCDCSGKGAEKSLYFSCLRYKIVIFTLVFQSFWSIGTDWDLLGCQHVFADVTDLIICFNKSVLDARSCWSSTSTPSSGLCAWMKTRGMSNLMQ